MTKLSFALHVEYPGFDQDDSAMSAQHNHHFLKRTPESSERGHSCPPGLSQNVKRSLRPDALRARVSRSSPHAGILPSILTFTANGTATRIQAVATLLIAALINFGWPWIAAADDASVQLLPATAIIRFAGTSTLHDFGGTLPSQPFTLVLSNRTWSADADVLASLMNTANEKRDRKMHEMFATNSFPKMHGTITAAPIPGVAGTNATLRLIIRNQTNDLTARITGWTENASAIKFHAVWELSLKDYALKPPSVLGVIKVGDRIKLEADVTASKTISTPTPSPRAP